MPPLKTRGFAHRIDIAVEPAKVWAVLCGPSLLPVWAGVGARIKPQKGGHWTIVPDAGPCARGDDRHLRSTAPPATDLHDATGPARVRWRGGRGHPAGYGRTEHRRPHALLRRAGLRRVGRPYFGKVRMHSERALARLKVLCEQRERMAKASSKGRGLSSRRLRGYRAGRSGRLIINTPARITARAHALQCSHAFAQQQVAPTPP